MDDELRWSDNYPERLRHLLPADVVVAPGRRDRHPVRGRAVWATVQTEPVAADLIFLGAGWPPVLRSFADHLVIDDRDLDPGDGVLGRAGGHRAHRQERATAAARGGATGIGG